MRKDGAGASHRKKDMHFTLREIEQATSGELYGADAVVTDVTIDSREAKAGSLYIAIRGDRFDGHDFCAAAVENGAAAVVCERAPQVKIPYILVESTRQAFLDIAGAYRQSLPHVKVVGLTGSVGKTTTKEMTYAVLNERYKTLKTEGNFNNEIGMPKTLLRLTSDTQAAVIEMGMNHFGEIERMTRSCRPDVGIITNIGVSHIEFLGSRDGILRAKTEILKGMRPQSVLILNGDDDKLWAFQNPDYKLLYFAIDNARADVRATDITEANGSTSFTVRFDGQTQRVTVPAVGRHHVYDALAAFCAGLTLSVSPDQIAKGLLNYAPAGMRQRMRTVAGITVIEDCYNASPDSQQAALEVLASLPAKRKIAVLGDMLELGDYTETAHRAVGAYAAKTKPDQLFCFGEASQYIADAAKDTVLTRHFTDKSELYRALSDTLRVGDAVLFKASRGMALEEVMEKLYKEWTDQ